MEQFFPLLVYPLLTALILSFLFTPIVIKFAKKLKIIDQPTRTHPAILHEKPTPRGGGVPIFAAILIASLIFLPLEQRLLGILLGGFVIALVGFLDDRFDINPYIRIGFQILAASFVVFSGIGIAFISNPIGKGLIDLSHPQVSFEFLGNVHTVWVLSVIFGAAWIIFLMNAVNWSSGVDGQLSGFAAIASLVIALLSLRFSADITQWSVTILAAIVCGAFLGFLPWHIYPQKIMPGFGGSSLAGYMLAVLSILATAKVGTLLVVLAIPIIDAVYVISRRLISGKSPVWGDRGHLHHRLLDSGWSKRKIAIFYWIATGFLGILALYLNAHQKFYTIIGAALVLGALILWLSFSSQLPKQPDHDSG